MEGGDVDSRRVGGRTLSHPEALCDQLHASLLHYTSTYVYLRHSLKKSALISPLPIVYIVMG